jgi:predicted O-methyltransferase YrrM
MDLEGLTAMARGFQESRALLTAVELDVFTAVGSGASARQVAERVGADPRAMEMLLHALVACDVLQKKDQLFQNVPVAAGHLTGAARVAWLHQVHLWNTWSGLTDAVRKGTAVFDAGLESRGPEWTEAFIAAMHRNAGERAPEVVRAIGLDRVRRVLDAGGGSGAYSIAFAQAAPELEADLLDLEPVTRIAQRHIDEAGLGARVHTRVGDLRQGSLGENYDLVFLSAICHMLSETENRDLIRRCVAACATGGRVVVQDFLLESDKTAPKFAALFSLNMLVGTPGGASYSRVEYEQWMHAAGLSDVQQVATPGPAGLMVGRRID